MQLTAHDAICRLADLLSRHSTIATTLGAVTVPADFGDDPATLLREALPVLEQALRAVR